MVFLRSSDQEQRPKHNEKTTNQTNKQTNKQANKYLMVFLRSSDQESQSNPSNQRGPAGSRPKDENIFIPIFIFRLVTNKNIIQSWTVITCNPCQRSSEMVFEYTASLE